MRHLNWQRIQTLFLLTAAAALVQSASVGAEVVPTKSKISKVTVYPGSARVTRTAELDLSAGKQSIALENIVPQLDENSLTVTGSGTANVKIFGAYLKREHSQEAADQRVKDLEAEIRDLGDQINAENQKLETLRKEDEFLASIKLFSGQQLPKDLVTQMPPVEKLEEVRQFLAARYAELEGKREGIRIKVRDLQEQLQVAHNKLNELRSYGSEQQSKFVVDLECVKAGKFTLEVSYLVYGAYWRSVYDARVAYEKKEVELISYGMIKQTTGEDWDDVQLTLSTAQPTVSGQMPDVWPWVLQPYQPAAPRRQALFQDKMMPANALMEMSARSSMDADSMAGAVPEEKYEAEMAYAEVQQKGISVVYEIAQPATLKSDGTDNKYPINTQKLSANFEYSTYPKAVPSAYLGSTVTNGKDTQLLAGEVNLFLEGDYIGKSAIENIGPGQEFYFYLGLDENVKVKREEIARNMDDVLVGGIKSSNRKTTVEYKITLENYKSGPVKVNVYEPTPVSQMEQIKVKTFDATPKPKVQDWKDRQGVWQWELTLNPRETKEIRYSFSVDHPRDFNIPGL